MKRILLAITLATVPILAHAQTLPSDPISQSGSGINAYTSGNSGATVQAGVQARSVGVGGSGYGGAGGQGGNAQGGSIAPGAVALSGFGNSNWQGSANPPGVYVPGGGGFDCPTVGFGASGAAPGGGGGFGPSWISSRCDNRKTYELLRQSGHQRAAELFWEKADDRIRAAMQGEYDELQNQPRPMPVSQPVHPAPLVHGKPGYCQHANNPQRWPECDDSQNGLPAGFQTAEHLAASNHRRTDRAQRHEGKPSGRSVIARNASAAQWTRHRPRS